MSTSLQSFYNAFSDVANAPTSTASRQALLGKAQSVASSFQNASSELNGLNTDVNSRISADVTQINSITSAISTLNKQIAVGTAQNGGQPPNELLDQRDQLVSNLSQLVGISTTTDSNGALNVFVGNGQALVLQGQTTALTTVPNQFNASQLEISTSALNGNDDQQQHHVRGPGRLAGGAHRSDQSRAESAGSSRNRVESDRQFATGRRPGFERHSSAPRYFRWARLR